MPKNTIFISIAAYRDPELLKTLKDCLDKAKHPENLRFGICWQHSPDDEWDNLDEYKDDPRFTIHPIHYKYSQGVCWARNVIQGLYKDETYYLQLDSHHRFDKNWDVTLIKMFKDLQKKGYKKPLLTAYLPSYEPLNESKLQEIWTLEFDRFLPQGPIFIKPHSYNNWKELKEPIMARFFSAHFVFTLGQWAKEVKYDPKFYFHGEESSLAARSFTFGYDLFHPHIPIIWHEYTRNGKIKQWDDDSTWPERDALSYSRYRKLFDMDAAACTPCARKQMAGFDFGNERTKEDYERYAGVKFRTREVHRHTYEYKELPLPEQTQEQFDNDLLNKIKVCIDVYKGSLPETDYINFAVAILDEAGNDIYRLDANQDEIRNLLNSDSNDQFIHIWREYEDNKKPHAWRVWPYSTSKGWCERLEQNIAHE
jgi:hypothetical protein